MLAMACALAKSKRQRRMVKRTEGGWKASTLNQYVENGDEQTYRENFRVSRATFVHIRSKLSGAGYVADNKCRDIRFRMTAAFKIGVSLYFLAHGCCVAKMVGDVASIGASTVTKYLHQFCSGVLVVLRPIYMPATPPTPAKIAARRAEFGKRRGINNVAMAADGSHVPVRGGPDYRNYKGWTSILAFAFVDSFYMFIDADVGAAGRAGDNSVLAQSWLLEQIKADPEAWLGKDGVIAADGGASDGGELLLNPILSAREPQDCHYNFCHSLTRFFVEETFGRWKNRFWFLLRESHLDHI